MRFQDHLITQAEYGVRNAPIFPATEVLTVENFYLEGHRESFRAMLAPAEQETSVDLFTLREELRRRSKEEAAAGPAYVASLTDGLPSGLNVGHYAKTVREKATARQLIQLSNEISAQELGILVPSAIPADYNDTNIRCSELQFISLRCRHLPGPTRKLSRLRDAKECRAWLSKCA